MNKFETTRLSEIEVELARIIQFLHDELGMSVPGMDDDDDDDDTDFERQQDRADGTLV